MYLALSPATTVKTFIAVSTTGPLRTTTGYTVPVSPSGYITDRFGIRLRTLRKARNMTQLDMAISFGIDRSFISDVERGKKAISLPLLEVIAIGFELSLSELLSDV